MSLTQPTQPGQPETSGNPFLTLRCPRCRQSIGNVLHEGFTVTNIQTCTRCGVNIPRERGVWKALLPEREAYFSRFVEDYEFIRAREGRGSHKANYYLALPDRDLSGRNRGQWAIRARSFHYVERNILPWVAPRRNARLRILDLGAGNGWMSYRLTRQSHLSVAVDLIANHQDGLEAAENYSSRLPFLFPRFQAELDNLPFTDRQFDLAIFNASFHYSECYETTLAEAIRCIRPGGVVIVADTAWYADGKDGQRMLDERRSMFLKRYGFASDELRSQEYLTNDRLDQLAKRFHLTWQIHTPNYGIRWRLRPWIAKLRHARTPSEFRIYAARVGL